ncbi:MAG TPA: sulfite exporter TauE/SafE family protein [Ignavibacteria bacterium]|mgnify:CR=1 FL=1|nr:sulfite exporter TauE/SafE family protein [Ignavibacteria bacterium]
MEIFKILPLVFLIAALYSSVGHGGASGYLALMSLLGISSVYMRSSALILNLFVSAIAFYQFYRAGYFKWKLFYIFAAASIPMAFIGAKINLDPAWYNRILGLFLIIAALRLTGIFNFNNSDKIKELPVSAGLLIGAVLGLLSGMIGIGGGILLSPVILLFGWGDIKETAAVSALFIFVNSLSGLLGLGILQLNLSSSFIWWIISAAAGGVLGSLWGSRFAKSIILKNVLAIVILFAAFKLILI